MRSSVTALQPRRQPFTTAVDAYRGGRPSDCLNALHGNQSLEARLLRARALLRSGRADHVIEELRPIDDADLFTSSRGELLTLRGAALTLTRQLEPAREMLDLARVYVYGSPSAALEAEYHLFEATWFFANGDFVAAASAAQQSLDVTSSPLFEQDDYFVPLEQTRARALQVQGVLAASREDYASQVQLTRRAVIEMAASPTEDLGITSALLMNLAFGVRDFDLVDDVQTLRAQNVDQWPADLALMKFHILRGLGWSSALCGDHLGAFRDFRRSADAAPSVALRIWATADRAYLAHELGEPSVLIRDEIEHAADLAQSVDWENAGGEDRFGLVLLAQQLAHFSPNRARGVFDRYRQIKIKLSPTILNSFDRRLRAYECCAEASIHRASGALEAAQLGFLNAFQIWEELGYQWLASTATIELAELGAGAKFVDYSVREAAKRPNSWLARRTEALKC